MRSSRRNNEATRTLGFMVVLGFLVAIVVILCTKMTNLTMELEAITTAFSDIGVGLDTGFANISDGLNAVHTGFPNITDLSSTCEFEEDPICDDRNECTTDGLRCDGTCGHQPLANGSTCTNECYSATSCQAGRCEGTCIGMCTVANDCPDLNQLNFALVNANSYDVGCSYGMCYYTTISQQPPYVVGASCGNSELAKHTCMKHFDTDLLPQVPLCMQHDAYCDLEVLTCKHFFACSCPEGFEYPAS